MPFFTFITIEILLMAAFVFVVTRRGTLCVKRLSRYVNVEARRAEGKKKSEDIYQVLDRKMDRVPLLKSIFNYIDHNLTMANVPVKTSEFLIIVLMLMIISLSAQIYFAGSYDYSSGIVVFISLLLPFIFLKIYIKIRLKKIRSQLKIAISLIANSMKAGSSFIQALRQVTTDMEDPLAAEFTLLLNENRLGIPIDEALLKMSKRVPCKELKALVRGVILQQQTGSNLVHILKTIFQTIQDRDDLLSKVSVLTIQGKISGVVCVAVPFLMFFLMNSSQPEYGELVFHTQAGNYLLAACGILITLGTLLIIKIVSFKV